MQHSPTHGNDTNVSATGVSSGAAMFDAAASPKGASELAAKAGGGATVYQRPKSSPVIRAIPMLLAFAVGALLVIILLLMRGGS